MSNKIPQEEWTPLPFMEGEHALSKVSVSAMQPCPYFFISLPLLRE